MLLLGCGSVVGELSWCASRLLVFVASGVRWPDHGVRDGYKGVGGTSTEEGGVRRRAGGGADDTCPRAEVYVGVKPCRSDGIVFVLPLLDATAHRTRTGAGAAGMPENRPKSPGPENTVCLATFCFSSQRVNVSIFTGTPSFFFPHRSPLLIQPFKYYLQST